MFKMLYIVIYNLSDVNVFNFFSKIEDIKLLINCSGYWEGSIWKDGYLEMIFVHKNLTYEVLLVMLHEIVCADLNSCVYEIKSLLNTNATIARFKIKNDKDVQYVLGKGDGIPKVMSRFNTPNSLRMLINQLVYNICINWTIKVLFSKNGMKFSIEPTQFCSTNGYSICIGKWDKSFLLTKYVD